MNTQADIEFEEDVYSLQDYLAILRRRRLPMLLTTASIALLAFVAAFALPAEYTSQSTILIEEQEVPREFVISTITSYAAQQIQVISQRVLTADNIARIADKFGLFIDTRTNRRRPATEIAEEFRQIMALELVSADVIDPRSGRPQEATIAFTLAFEHENPATAQKVTNELVTLFLDENLRNRTSRVESTEAFLNAQAESLDEELVRIDKQIAEIKRDSGAALPELYQYNLTTLDRTSQQLNDVDRRMRELARSKTDLTARLGMGNPSSTQSTSTGEALLSLQEQLRALNAEYQQKSTLYQDEHPDLVNIKRRVDELQTTLGTTNNSNNQATATNPSFILLQTQLDSVAGEITSLTSKRAELEDKLARFDNLISISPTVEIEYNRRLREYQTTQQKYQDVRAKQREAELSEHMEQERKGERFLMVEPPNLPLEPSSPNRPAIAIIGLILAIGAGVGIALLLEALDSGVFDDKTLTKLTGAPSFAVVGYIETHAELAGQRRLRRRLWYAAIGAAVALLLFVHFVVKPLDVLWFMLLNRAGL